MPLWIEIVLSLVLLLGVSMCLIGSIGLLRLPDLYMRLHAPTKASTLGLGCLIIASQAFMLWYGKSNFAVFLIILFVFITAPVTANLIAQAAIHLRLRTLNGDVPEALERPLPWQSHTQVQNQIHQAADQPPKH